jgi:hypothetical protein
MATSRTDVRGNDFSVPEQTKPAGHRVDLHDEARRLAQAVGQHVGHDRAQLDHGVVALALDAPRAHDDPLALEVEVRRVEEVHHPDLRRRAGRGRVARTADRWPASATVILSSTLSEPFRRPSISASCSSDRRGAAAVAMG